MRKFPLQISTSVVYIWDTWEFLPVVSMLFKMKISKNTKLNSVHELYAKSSYVKDSDRLYLNSIN